MRDSLRSQRVEKCIALITIVVPTAAVLSVAVLGKGMITSVTDIVLCAVFYMLTMLGIL